MKWWNRPMREPAAPRVSRRHGRHGRAGRSIVVRPPLPSVNTRHERFELAVGSAAEFLRSGWPELRDVVFEIASMPDDAAATELRRWKIDHSSKRITIYRVPIERSGIGPGPQPTPLGHDRRAAAGEAITFRAAAEYLGREPWQIGPPHSW